MATPDSLGLAAEVIAAYVSNNPVPKSDLPDLILAVHSSLARLGSEPEHAVPRGEGSGGARPKVNNAGLFDLSGGWQTI